MEEKMKNVETQSNDEINQNDTMQKNKTINVCGLISFIFSMIGLVVFGLPCGIIAIILGIIGLITFKKEKHKLRWMAITGLSVGAAEVIIMILYIVSIAVVAGSL